MPTRMRPFDRSRLSALRPHALVTAALLTSAAIGARPLWAQGLLIRSVLPAYKTQVPTGGLNRSFDDAGDVVAAAVNFVQDYGLTRNVRNAVAQLRPQAESAIPAGGGVLIVVLLQESARDPNGYTMKGLLDAYVSSSGKTFEEAFARHRARNDLNLKAPAGWQTRETLLWVTKPGEAPPPPVAPPTPWDQMQTPVPGRAPLGGWRDTDLRFVTPQTERIVRACESTFDDAQERGAGLQEAYFIVADAGQNIGYGRDTQVPARLQRLETAQREHFERSGSIELFDDKICVLREAAAVVGLSLPPRPVYSATSRPPAPGGRDPAPPPAEREDARAGANPVGTPSPSPSESNAAKAAEERRLLEAKALHNTQNDATRCVYGIARKDFSSEGVSSSANAVLRNSCPFPVTVTWCIAGFDCNPGFSNVATLPGRGSAGSDRPINWNPPPGGVLGSKLSLAACAEGFTTEQSRLGAARQHACR